MVRPSLSADIVAHLQVGMFEELVKAFVLGVETPDLDGLADQMADFEWNGVRPAARSKTRKEDGMRALVCGIGFAIALSAVVAAQTPPDFSALRARVGDTVVVTDAAGVEVGGRLTALSPSALSIDGIRVHARGSGQGRAPRRFHLGWRCHRLRRWRAVWSDHWR